ncbi:MAG: hypothetical protein Q8Q25_01435 [bacterium]|nr:hypothetical protein [bacterium]
MKNFKQFFFAGSLIFGMMNLYGMEEERPPRTKEKSRHVTWSSSTSDSSSTPKKLGRTQSTTRLQRERLSRSHEILPSLPSTPQEDSLLVASLQKKIKTLEEQKKAQKRALETAYSLFQQSAHTFQRAYDKAREMEETTALEEVMANIHDDQPVSPETVRQLSSINQSSAAGTTPLVAIFETLIAHEQGCNIACRSLRTLLANTEGHIDLAPILLLLKKSASKRLKALVDPLEREQSLRSSLQAYTGGQPKSKHKETMGSIKASRRRSLSMLRKIQDGEVTDWTKESDSDQ